MVSPHGYHGSGVTSLFQPKVTILNEEVVCIYMYSCKLRYLVKLHKFTLLITFYMMYIYFIDKFKCNLFYM